jgi:hypothetical protein
VDSILTGFIAGRRHDAASGSAAHDQWSTLEIRVVPLLDRGKKSIHVNMQNHGCTLACLPFAFKILALPNATESIVVAKINPWNGLLDLQKITKML